MSHFSTIQTQLVEKKYLLQALTDLGYEWEEGTLEVNGFNGNRTPAEIRIRTGNRNFDIGFKKQEEKYEIIADWWGIKNIKQEEFVRQLTQRYACNAVKDQFEQQDFAFIQEEVQADNSIHITLRRMT